jgi:hypothetical protein
MPGPVPKREEDRARTNAPEIPIETIEVYGEVTPPELNLPFGADQMVIDFYESLKKSAFAKYYEPSDWEYARLACFIMQRIVSTNRPSAEMFKALQTALSNLLVTEGDRRRLRIEIARAAEKPAQTAEEEHMAEVIGMYQKQMQEYAKEA